MRSQTRFLSWVVLALAAWGGAAASRSLAQEEPSPSDPVAVERLVIRFASGQFAIFSRHATRKVLPPSDELPAETVTGFWYEVRSAESALRYRRILENPIPLVFEGPEQPDAPPGSAAVRNEAIPSERLFSLLVPAPVQGDELVLFSSPLTPGAQGEPASEVGRLDLAPVVIP